MCLASTKQRINYMPVDQATQDKQSNKTGGIDAAKNRETLKAIYNHALTIKKYRSNKYLMRQYKSATECGTFTASKTAKAKKGSKSINVSGLNHCNCNACAVCAVKQAKEWRETVIDIDTHLSKRGFYTAMITPTLPHGRTDGADDLIPTLQRSFKKLLMRRPVKRELERVCEGAPHWIRVIETTANMKNGIHAHFHVLLWVKGEDLDELRRLVDLAWRDIMRKEGREANEAGINITADPDEKYIVKMAGWSHADELTQAHRKDAGRNNGETSYSLFELRDLAFSGQGERLGYTKKFLDRAKFMFHDIMAAMQGVPVFKTSRTITPELREQAKAERRQYEIAQMTDQELADQIEDEIAQIEAQLAAPTNAEIPYLIEPKTNAELFEAASESTEMYHTVMYCYLLNDGKTSLPLGEYIKDAEARNRESIEEQVKASVIQWRADLNGRTFAEERAKLEADNKADYSQRKVTALIERMSKRNLNPEAKRKAQSYMQERDIITAIPDELINEIAAKHGA